MKALLMPNQSVTVGAAMRCSTRCSSRCSNRCSNRWWKPIRPRARVGARALRVGPPSVAGRLQYADRLAIQVRQRILDAVLVILLVDFDDAVPEVRRQYDVGRAGERVTRRQRLTIEDIERGDNATRLDRGDERVLVDQRSARRIDQD